MKLLVIVTVIFLVCLRVSASETANNPTSKAEACSSCHNGIINLKGRGVDEIIKQTKSIQSADKPHPPTGIKELSDEDIAEIAAFLDKA